MLATAVHAQEAPPAQDVAPGAGKEGVVHVNAVKNPEMHAYRAIVAGLDMFDDQHALAPAVPRLQFQISTRNGMPLAALPSARLSADDFDLALPVGADALFLVPRNQRAWDDKAELRLSRKRNEVKVIPYVRTPGLAEDRRRLGDLRLECKVMIAIVKEEIPFWASALVSSLLVTRDWCSFFKTEDRLWSVQVPATLGAATLREGERTLALKVHDNAFELPLALPGWSDDALVELQFAGPVAAPVSPAAAASTALSTPPAGER